MIVLSTIRYSKSLSPDIASKRRHQTPLLSPAAEASKNAVPIAEHIRQVTPRRARAHDPHHRLDEYAIVAPEDPRVRSSRHRLPLICSGILKSSRRSKLKCARDKLKWAARLYDAARTRIFHSDDDLIARMTMHSQTCIPIGTVDMNGNQNWGRYDK